MNELLLNPGFAQSLSMGLAMVLALMAGARILRAAVQSEVTKAVDKLGERWHTVLEEHGYPDLAKPGHDAAVGPYRTPALLAPPPASGAAMPAQPEPTVLLPYTLACTLCGREKAYAGDGFERSCIKNDVCQSQARVAGCTVSGTHVHRACSWCSAKYMSRAPDEPNPTTFSESSKLLAIAFCVAIVGVGMAAMLWAANGIFR
jgi:hypothetical protein